MVIKKFVSFILIFLIFFCFNINSYADNDITLVINGSKIDTDVSPMIINNRTMVPVRVLFSAFGADVVWNDVFRQVVITTDYSVIIFTIDSCVAYVNGYSKILDVAPTIVDGRTLVPVRFISETLGYEVDWYASKRIVYINHKAAQKEPENKVENITPVNPKPEADDKGQSDLEQKPNNYDTDLKSVSVASNSGNTVITVDLTKKTVPKVMTLSEPDRIVLDFYDVNQLCKDEKIIPDNQEISSVRWATHDTYTRLVVESTSRLKYDLSYESSKCILTVYNNSQTTTPQKPVITNKPTVVIDAGHGGNDCGAVGRDANGNVVLYEANVNLDIALRIQKILESYGINVIMTRTTNVSLGSSVMEDLVKRADIANNANADLFVSVHNNAFSDPESTGTTVLYAGLSNNGGYGISSQEVAQKIQNYLVKATGLKDRGITRSPNIVVLKRTDMPAVLLECGFVSCYEDQKVLTDNNKLNDIANAVCNGILDSLKKMGKIK